MFKKKKKLENINNPLPKTDTIETNKENQATDDNVQYGILESLFIRLSESNEKLSMIHEDIHEMLEIIKKE